MDLLQEKVLILSAVVANNRMNRERNAGGINSYEKDIYFHPGPYLKDHIRRFGQVRWLDLCCGKGKALLQCALELADAGFQHQAALKGIDLIDGFQPMPPGISCLHWQVGSVVDWVADDPYDLITCVHGLHYIGDKLRVISNACRSLTAEGIFIAHLDLQNIKLPAQTIRKKLGDAGIEYHPRKRILTCKGPREVDFGVRYEGASDQVGPNYTGQEAVDSYYQLLPITVNLNPTI